MNSDNEYVQILNKCLPVSSRFCSICFSDIPEKISTQIHDEMDQFIFDSLNCIYGVIYCGKCKREYHEACLPSQLSREEFICQICSDSKKSCIICNQSEGWLLAIQGSEFFGHFVCLYFSANFLMADIQSQIFIPIYEESYKFYLDNQSSGEICWGCKKVIILGDSKFKCYCGKVFHFFCGMYIDQACKKPSGRKNLGPIFKINSFKDYWVDKYVGPQAVQTFAEFSKLLNLPKAFPLSQLGPSANCCINFEYFVFEMECEQCSSRRTRNCCYQLSQHAAMAECCVCGDWIHDYCSQRFSEDEGIIQNYLHGISLAEKKENPLSKHFVCKICTHFTVSIYLSHTDDRVELSPKHLPLTLFILKNIYTATFVAQLGFINKFYEKTPQRFTEIYFIKSLKLDVIFVRIAEAIRTKTINEDFFIEIECEVQNLNLEDCPRISYLKILMTVLSNATESQNFDQIEKDLSCFALETKFLAENPVRNFINTYIFNKYISPFNDAQFIIEKEMFNQRDKYFDIQKKLAGKKSLKKEDIMDFLRSKLKKDNIVKKMQEKKNIYIEIFLRENMFSEALKKDLLSFDPEKEQSFDFCNELFERLIKLDVWTELYSPEIEKFVTYYLKALSFIQIRANIVQKVESLCHLFFSVEGKGFITLRNRLFDIKELEELRSLFKIQVKNDHFEELYQRSIEKREFFQVFKNEREDFQPESNMRRIFSEIAYNKIAIDKMAFDFLDEEITKFNFENPAQPFTLAEFLKQEETISENFKNTSFERRFQRTNEERIDLEREIQEVCRVVESHFFIKENFKKMDDLERRAVKLNLKNDFIQTWRVNVDFLEQLNLAVSTDICLEDEDEFIQPVEIDAQKIRKIPFNRLAQLADYRIPQFLSDNCRQNFNLLQVIFIESYFLKLKRELAIPEMCFLDDYCSDKKIVEYKNLVSCETLERSQNFHDLDAMKILHDEIQTQAESLWELILEDFLFSNEIKNRIEIFMNYSQKVNFKDHPLRLKILGFFIYHVFFRILDYFANQKIVMRRKLPLEKLKNEENNNFSQIAEFKDDLINSLSGPYSHPEHFNNFSPRVEIQNIIHHIIIEVGKYDSLFRHIQEKTEEWKKIRIPNFESQCSKFVIEMLNYHQVYRGQLNVFRQFTENHFGNKHHKVEKKQIVCLLKDLNEFSWLHFEYAPFYEERLQYFAKISEDAFELIKELNSTPLNQILNGPLLNSCAQIYNQFCNQQIKSEESKNAFEIAEGIICIKKEDKAQIHILNYLLSNISSKLPEESILKQSIATIFREWAYYERCLKNLSKETPSEEAFFIEIAPLYEASKIKGLQTCFYFADFDSFQEEINIFCNREWKIRNFLNFFSSKKSIISLCRPWRLSLEEVQRRIKFINERLHGESDMESKILLYHSVNYLGRENSQVYAFRIRQFYDEINKERQNFSVTLNRIELQLRNLLETIHPDWTPQVSAKFEGLDETGFLKIEEKNPVVRKYEHHLYMIERFIFQVLFLLFWISNVGCQPLLRRLIATFPIWDSIQEFQNEMETDQTKFSSKLIDNLIYIITVALNITGAEAEKLVKNKSSQYFWEKCIEIKKSLRNSDSSISDFLKEYMYSIFQNAKNLFENFYQKYLEKKEEETFEKLMEKLNYDEYFLGPKAEKKILKFKKLENFSKDFENLLLQTLKMINRQHQLYKNSQEGYMTKFTIKKNNLEEKNLETLIKGGSEINRLKLTHEENFAMYFSLKQHFKKLMNFTKKILQSQLEFEKLKRKKFDAQFFMQNFEEYLSQCLINKKCSSDELSGLSLGKICENISEFELNNTKKIKFSKDLSPAVSKYFEEEYFSHLNSGLIFGGILFELLLLASKAWNNFDFSSVCPLIVLSENISFTNKEYLVAKLENIQKEVLNKEESESRFFTGFILISEINEALEKCLIKSENAPLKLFAEKSEIIIGKLSDFPHEYHVESSLFSYLYQLNTQMAYFIIIFAKNPKNLKHIPNPDLEQFKSIKISEIENFLLQKQQLNSNENSGFTDI